MVAYFRWCKARTKLFGLDYSCRDEIFGESIDDDGGKHADDNQNDVNSDGSSKKGSFNCPKIDISGTAYAKSIDIFVSLNKSILL